MNIQVRNVIAMLVSVSAFGFSNLCTAAVPAAGLVGAYNFNSSSADSSGRGHTAYTSGVTRTTNRFGTANYAYYFNGTTAYLRIPDHDDFSPSTTGYLSISVWVRPEGTSLDGSGELLFSGKINTGYVHWMGKGNTSGDNGNREWALRIYSADNSEGRHNRMSAYLFNYYGDLGPGSYVQEPVTNGGWIHYVVIYSRPDKKIWWYKNGVLRDTDNFGTGSSYPIADGNLRNGGADVYIGGRQDDSYFKGAIDNVYFYNRKLTLSEIQSLYNDTTP